MAHAAGALVLVDGAQAVPHVPVDVQGLGADFYAFSGHKMLAPMGSGALWARAELLEAMPPFLSGGEMIREVHLRRSDFNEIPWKFEAGTPAVGDAIGLGVAADYLKALGMDAVREHERDLVTYALTTLPANVPGIELYGPAADLRGGVVPFNLPGIHPHDVAQVLDRYGVAVRAGHHCTMPLHERLDLAATARASFNVYSTREDIDALVAGLLEVQRVFNG
jgi:cysteine desulfurase/selenocysteine lyase